VIVLISLLLVSNESTFSSIVAAATVVLMILLHKILKKFNILDSCNCYGRALKKNPVVIEVVNFYLLFASGFVILSGFFRLPTLQFNLGEFAVVLVVICSTLIANFSDLKFKILFFFYQIFDEDETKKKNSSKIGKIYSKELHIGNYFDGRKFELKNIANFTPLVMIVGLDEQCDECQEFKPILFKLADAFQSEIQTIFVIKATNQSHIQNENGIILEAADDFFEEINAKGFPFCVLFRAQDFSQIGNVSVTALNIWKIYHQSLLFLRKRNLIFKECN